MQRSWPRNECALLVDDGSKNDDFPHISNLNIDTHCTLWRYKILDNGCKTIQFFVRQSLSAIANGSDCGNFVQDKMEVRQRVQEPFTMQLAAEWIKWDMNAETQSEIQAMMDGQSDKLQELLGKRLEFGTAGLRGPMGAGNARMNDLVVVQTTQVGQGNSRLTTRDCSSTSNKCTAWRSSSQGA